MSDNTLGVIIICCLIYISILAASFDEPIESGKDKKKEYGKRIFWPIYVTIWTIVFICYGIFYLFHFLNDAVIGFGKYIKEDFINQIKTFKIH